MREFALGHLLVRAGEIVEATVETPLDLSAEIDAELAAGIDAGSPS